MSAIPASNPNFGSVPSRQGAGDLIRTFPNLIYSPPSWPTPPADADPSEELRAEGFKSNALVVLSGDLHPRTPKLVRLNGSRPAYLNRRQFVVLLVLAWHARFWATSSIAVRAGRSPFLSASEILDWIDELKLLLPPALAVFESAEPLAVTKVISEFRKAVRAIGEDAAILQTGPGNFGYRWSVPARNLTVRFSPLESSN